MSVHWQVRVWDESDEPSEWSSPARWTTGLLDPKEWKAKLIDEGVVDETEEWKIVRDGNGAFFKWGQHKSQAVDSDLWRRKSINKSLQALVACSGNPPQQIYRALLMANAINLLSFDIEQQEKIKVPVSGNVGWLDFTHGLTFASAVRQQCTRFPELWPQGLKKSTRGKTR